MTTVRVNASKSYDIIIGSGLLGDVSRYMEDLGNASSAVIVSDDNVYGLYGEKLKKSLEKCGFRVCEFVFPRGERSKNLATYEKLLTFMCGMRITRSDIIIALGGGVTGDLAGFAAATYKRGIRYVQIPTTLLAAVDSSVGGKTAVDLENGKNQVGCFYQPSLVICDVDTLSTLPEEEFRCGFAEVIKYAVIGDEGFFEDLSEKHIKDQLEYVIETCVRMKRDLVERDEFDVGERMLLNFGHTFGHAAEVCSDFSILHGQAVAMGMAAITRSSAFRGYCDLETEKKLAGILEKYGLPVSIPYPLDDMADAVLSDKKLTGDTISVIVPERIGKCRIEAIPASSLRDWLKEGGVE